MKKPLLYLISYIGVAFLITQPVHAQLEEATTTLRNYTYASIEGQYFMIFFGILLGGITAIILRIR